MHKDFLENDNEFYFLQQTSDTEFCSAWGPIGKVAYGTEVYPMADYEKTLQNKLAAGYKVLTNRVIFSTFPYYL